MQVLVTSIGLPFETSTLRDDVDEVIARWDCGDVIGGRGSSLQMVSASSDVCATWKVDRRGDENGDVKTERLGGMALDVRCRLSRYVENPESETDIYHDSSVDGGDENGGGGDADDSDGGVPQMQRQNVGARNRRIVEFEKCLVLPLTSQLPVHHVPALHQTLPLHGTRFDFAGARCSFLHDRYPPCWAVEPPMIAHPCRATMGRKFAEWQQWSP